MRQRPSSWLLPVAATAATTAPTTAPATAKPPRLRRRAAAGHRDRACGDGDRGRRKRLGQAASASAPARARPGGSGQRARRSPRSGVWTIAVVTDVGTIDDKNFNQYSYEGAKLGAHSIGAADPPYVVPKDSSEYAADIQTFIDQGANLIVTVGFNLNTDTLKAAKNNPNVWFIGVDQNACVDETGAPDPNFALRRRCQRAAAELRRPPVPGGPGGLSRRHRRRQHQPEQQRRRHRWHQPAFLRSCATSRATSSALSRSTRRSRSIPAYVVDRRLRHAFNNPGAGKTFADQFIQTNKPDVVFQVAGKTGNGVLQSACAAGIYGHRRRRRPVLSLNAATDPTYGCIVTSAEKHLSSSVAATIQEIYLKADGSADRSARCTSTPANDGIGVSPDHDGNSAQITADIQARLDAAVAAMQAAPLHDLPATRCDTAQ